MTPQVNDTIAPVGPEPAPIRPSVAALFVAFLRLGLTAFGGPAMVVYIRELADRIDAWRDDTRPERREKGERLVGAFQDARRTPGQVNLPPNIQTNR